MTSRSSKGCTSAGPSVAILRGTLPGKRQGLVDRLAGEGHAGAQPLHGLDLEDRCLAGHEHLARDAVQHRRLGDGPAVVAGTGGDQAGAGTRPERGHLRERAAQLEGSGPLQALALEGQRAAGEWSELLGGDRRRVQDVGRHRSPRRVEVEVVDQLLGALTHRDPRYTAGCGRRSSLAARTRTPIGPAGQSEAPPPFRARGCFDRACSARGEPRPGPAATPELSPPPQPVNFGVITRVCGWTNTAARATGGHAASVMTVFTVSVCAP